MKDMKTNIFFDKDPSFSNTVDANKGSYFAALNHHDFVYSANKLYLSPSCLKEQK